MSERDWQAQVVELLEWNRWKHYHTFDARRSVVGFPDLIALHPASGDRLVAELKSERGKAAPEQLEWLAWFEACGVDSYLWRPSDVDAMIVRVSKSR